MKKTDPVPTGFWWAQFGSFGKQLVHLGTAYDAEWIRGHKWRDKSRRWTGEILVARKQLLSPADLREVIVQRAVRAATPGHPPCRHEEHHAAQLDFGWRT